ncbi:Imm26 family immunity protein [Pseudomonas putida]|uniref:Imm26 family immunity protein n=1 Tax=Pseudomonas putida TaxID=303 RepID=UPI001F5209F0|nr:Imm26 family immunity protein [Pseudomonas putida]
MMGWWNVPGKNELVVGDIPLDRIGKLLEELQELYLESLGRRPALGEISYMIELSLKVNGPGLFHGLETGSDKCEDASVRKNQAIKYSSGDILAFKIDEEVYGFARLIRKIELGYVSEIYCETAVSPSEGLSVINKIKKFPVILDTFSLLEMGEGEWSVIGNAKGENDDKIDGLRFVFGTPPFDLKSIDVNEDEKKISENDSLGLPPYEQMGDEDVKELFEAG